MTKILILQPGDVFSIEYTSWVERWGFGEENPTKKVDKGKEPKLVIQKLPFTINKDWSYNEWLTDYLPPEN